MIEKLHRCLKICALLSMCCVSSEWVADNSTQFNRNWPVDFEDNLIDINHVPSEALNGVYYECILGLSFACLQRKLIAFLFELDRMKSINLYGDAVRVICRNVSVDKAESARIAQRVDESFLQVIDHLVDRFFDNHFLRVRIPRYLEDSEAMETSEEDLLYLDFGFRSNHQISEMEDRSNWRIQNRRKKSRNSRSKKEKIKIKKKVKKKKKVKRKKDGRGKFRLKGLKKVMAIIGLSAFLKLAAMALLFLGMIGLKAKVAFVFSIMAFTIHKILLLKRLDFSSLLSSGHGDSGGGHGSGGGHTSGGSQGSGWDRIINEGPSTASTFTFPYYIEPPSP